MIWKVPEDDLLSFQVFRTTPGRCQSCRERFGRGVPSGKGDAVAIEVEKSGANDTWMFMTGVAAALNDGQVAEWEWRSNGSSARRRVLASGNHFFRHMDFHSFPGSRARFR